MWSNVNNRNTKEKRSNLYHDHHQRHHYASESNFSTAAADDLVATSSCIETITQVEDEILVVCQPHKPEQASLVMGQPHKQLQRNVVIWVHNHTSRSKGATTNQLICALSLGRPSLVTDDRASVHASFECTILL